MSHGSPLKIVVAAALPVVVSLWLSIPTLRPEARTVTGSSSRVNVCLGICGDVLNVGNTTIACRADLLGVSYSCGDRVFRAGQAIATYLPLPSLARLFGLAPTAGTLTRLEVGGQVVYRKSVTHIVWTSLYGGWVFHAVYWPSVGLILWLWPRSRLGQRLARTMKGEA